MRPGVSLDAGPERPRGVVQAGLRSPDGNSGSCRHLGDRKPEVVVEDQDGALLDGEPPEGALEQVAVVHGQVVVGAVRALDGKDPRALVPPLATPGLGVARVGEDAVEPRFEAGWVAQGSKLGPGRDQGGLDGVLGQVDVAEDPAPRSPGIGRPPCAPGSRTLPRRPAAPDGPAPPAPIPPHPWQSAQSGPITMKSVRGSLAVQSGLAAQATVSRAASSSDRPPSRCRCRWKTVWPASGPTFVTTR